MENKRIFITGAAGSIGSEVVRQLVDKNILYLLDNNETGFFDLYEELQQQGKEIYGRIGDVRDKNTLMEVCNSFKPDIIFHCAALKHVTPNEWNPEEAIYTNVLGTLNVVKVAKKFGIEKLINISTDKAVNVNSVMGTTKRLGELIVKNAGYISVRFGNVLGSRGSVIPIWQKQINENKPLTITDDRMKRFFMTIEEAVQLVIKAAQVGQSGEIIILDMGEQVSVLELAKNILKKSGKDLQIQTIGIRQGESLNENLMTEEEQKRANKQGNFYIIK